MLRRPRRNRKNQGIRNLVSETHFSLSKLVYPIFIQESNENTLIESMPGISRFGREGLLFEIEEIVSLGIPAVILFPAVSNEKKTSGCLESINEEGLVPHSVREIKKRFPNLLVMTDVALDPYNSDGHDGIVDKDSGEILNEETVEVLSKQALLQAQCGADVIAPSDMMDGRIRAIRQELDKNNFENVNLLSYTAKYASSFYGPFRGALDSAPKSGDKKTYQMDYRNRKEALLEAQLDWEEGADMLMVKPAGYYLDIIADFSKKFPIPIAAYQVSGEYLMIKAASKAGWLDEKGIVLESINSIFRAGAQFCLTYYAKQLALWNKS